MKELPLPSAASIVTNMCSVRIVTALLQEIEDHRDETIPMFLFDPVNNTII